jgi:hypothetical protein
VPGRGGRLLNPTERGGQPVVRDGRPAPRRRKARPKDPSTSRAARATGSLVGPARKAPSGDGRATEPRKPASRDQASAWPRTAQTSDRGAAGSGLPWCGSRVLPARGRAGDRWMRTSSTCCPITLRNHPVTVRRGGAACSSRDRRSARPGGRGPSWVCRPEPEGTGYRVGPRDPLIGQMSDRRSIEVATARTHCLAPALILRRTHGFDAPRGFRSRRRT